MAEGKLKGVYSTESSTAAGAGMSRRSSVVKRYWSVWSADEMQVLAQPLNQNLIPIGPKRSVPMEEFEARYVLEPDFFVEEGEKQAKSLWRAEPEPPSPSPSPAPPRNKEPKTPPAAAKAQPTPVPAGKEDWEAPPREKAVLDLEPYDAIDPLEEVLERVEHSARADFAMAMGQLKKGNKKKARKVFEELAALDAAFKPRHKHMFNEFGIGLRKNDLHDAALMHYNRALGLSPKDENIYHNIARIHYEQGDLAKAVKNLEKSLDLNPDLRESRLFLEFIKKKRKRKFSFSI